MGSRFSEIIRVNVRGSDVPGVVTIPPRRLGLVPVASKIVHSQDPNWTSCSGSQPSTFVDPDIRWPSLRSFPLLIARFWARCPHEQVIPPWREACIVFLAWLISINNLSNVLGNGLEQTHQEFVSLIQRCLLNLLEHDAQLIAFDLLG